MVCGLGEAARLVSADLSAHSAHMRAMRDRLEDRLHAAFAALGGVAVNGKCAASDRLPNTCNFAPLRAGLRGPVLLPLSTVRLACMHGDDSMMMIP